MKLPNLSRRLILQERVRADDGLGGQSGSWAALGVHWGDVSVRSGRERVIGGRERSDVMAKVVVRAMPPGSPSRPRPDQRFVDGARVYGILAVTELPPHGHYLRCDCVEGFEQ